ncbi:hypothetical protein D3C80_991200 [compost metagenome]
MQHRDIGRQVVHRLITRRIISDHDNLLDALGCQLAGDLRHADRPVHGLTTRHRNGVVVKDFVGDVYISCHRSPNSQQPGMKVGTITQVGKDMGSLGERGLTNPCHTFPTHLTECLRLRIDPRRHVVTADPRQRATTFRHLGGTVVRATGAIVRHPIHEGAETVVSC